MKILNVCHTFAWIPAFCVATYLNGCATKAGKQAHSDSVAIAGHVNNASKEIQSVQTLDQRVDSKDYVLEHARIIP